MVYKQKKKRTVKKRNGEVDLRQKKAASLRRKIKALLDNECFICGYHRCLRALELHHVVSSRKRFNVSMNILKYKWESIVRECCKCVLLCNRCHTEVEDNIIEISKKEIPDEYYSKLRETLKPPKNKYKSKSYSSVKTKSKKYTRKRTKKR